MVVARKKKAFEEACERDRILAEEESLKVTLTLTLILTLSLILALTCPYDPGSIRSQTRQRA